MLLTRSHVIVINKLFIHIVCLYLIINLYWQAFSDNLGADPVEFVIHFTGIGALNLLLLSLFISPAAQLFKWSFMMQFRRLLGLYSFTYALAHLLSFLAFEIQFDWALFSNELIDRPYITVGLGTFVILLMLAVTSTNRVKRYMKQSWQKLHNWVYLAAILAVVHFYMSVKSDISEPLFYIAITGVLLWCRRKKLRKHF